MTSTQPSGIDLARAALAAARADAKTRPAQPQRKTRTTRTRSRSYGDPMGLGAAITAMMTERDWQPPEPGGSIIDQWATIAPELADKVAAVRFEHDTGTLHLKPVSPAYATQLRLHQTQILAKVQQAPSGKSVRALKILPAGTAPEPTAAADTEPDARPEPQGPVKTRETASAGYRHTRALVLENRPTPPPVNPYIEEARQRQIAALRASRPPETEDREAHWAQADAEQTAGPRPGSSEAARRAALAYKRQDQTGTSEPRRLFGAA